MKKLLIALLFCCSVLRGYAPVNFNKPYDFNFKMRDWELEKGVAKYKLGVNVEGGTTRDARNHDSDKVGLLEIYDSSQSAIAMLLAAEKGSEIYKLAQEISPATDDGKRGRFKLENGKYEGLDYSFFLERNFELDNISGRFYVTGYLPLRYMKIGGVKLTDLTDDKTNMDLLVKEKLTSDIKGILSTLGGLDVNDWSEHGLGDVTILLGWRHDFKQETKRNLDKVRLTARLGLTLPTGRRKDEDRAFSLPLGNDGAVGIPCSGALDLFFKGRIRFGIELEFLKLFDETRNRRLKTDTRQTDFFLLHKGRARKDFGSEWKFNLHLQAEHFLGGLSARVAFQHSMHDDDKLRAKSHKFDNAIINSMESLKDTLYSNLIFQADYDFFRHSKKWVVKPQLSFFAKFAIAGRRIVDADTFGGQFALNF